MLTLEDVPLLLEISVRFGLHRHRWSRPVIAHVRRHSFIHVSIQEHVPLTGGDPKAMEIFRLGVAIVMLYPTLVFSAGDL